MTVGDDTEFTLHDAMEVLRLLDDDQSPIVDVSREAFRFQCVRAVSSRAATPQMSSSDARASAGETERHTVLRAPAAGRFYGRAEVFGARGTTVNAGDIVGRIEAGDKVTPVMADCDGVVAHACVPSGEFVQYGQALLITDSTS